VADGPLRQTFNPEALMEEKSRPCEICGEAIDADRAEALPETRLCSVHAGEIARYGGEFRVTVSESRLSKPGSLKNNPGDVAVTGKTRNLTAIAKLRADYERSGQ
jgi:hypothetical protein